MPRQPLFPLALPLALCLLPACVIFDPGGDDGGDDATYGDPSGTTSGPTSGPTSGWNPTSAGESTSTTAPIEPTGADNEPEAGCPCAPGTDLIYVLSDIGVLWSFDPIEHTFTRLAAITCGGMTDTFSMGVSRKARAWIQFQSGDLYTVDLNDPSDPIPCKDPGFIPPNDPKFANFGMAFVANSLEDPCDRLYAHSATEPGLYGPGVGGLGAIDPQTLLLAAIAPIDYAWGELTGSGDGRLFAYAGAAPPLLIEYDKADGLALDVLPLPALGGDSAFAFAWYGGDFFLFIDPDPFGNISQVWHLDYDQSDGGKQALTFLGDAPIRVVGAGVSTCVPWGPT
jgi:hypothetical protein